jgi:hypothetical protein
MPHLAHPVNGIIRKIIIIGISAPQYKQRFLIAVKAKLVGVKRWMKPRYKVRS